MDISHCPTLSNRAGLAHRALTKNDMRHPEVSVEIECQTWWTAHRKMWRPLSHLSSLLSHLSHFLTLAFHFLTLAGYFPTFAETILPQNAELNQHTQYVHRTCHCSDKRTPRLSSKSNVGISRTVVPLVLDIQSLRWESFAKVRNYL